MAGYDQSAIIK